MAPGSAYKSVYGFKKVIDSNDLTKLPALGSKITFKATEKIVLKSNGVASPDFILFQLSSDIYLNVNDIVIFIFDLFEIDDYRWVPISIKRYSDSKIGTYTIDRATDKLTLETNKDIFFINGEETPYEINNITFDSGIIPTNSIITLIIEKYPESFFYLGSNIKFSDTNLSKFKFDFVQPYIELDFVYDGINWNQISKDLLLHGTGTYEKNVSNYLVLSNNGNIFNYVKENTSNETISGVIFENSIDNGSVINNGKTIFLNVPSGIIITHNDLFLLSSKANFLTTENVTFHFVYNFQLNKWIELNNVTKGSLSQVQSDWTQTNPASPSFIKNKPNVSVKNIFAGTPNTFNKSLTGETWEPVTINIQGYISAITNDPTKGIIYIGTSNGYVYKYQNNSLDTGILVDSLGIKSIECYSDGNSISGILVITNYDEANSYIYKSLNDAESWNNIGQISSFVNSSLVIENNTSNVEILIFAETGIYSSLTNITQLKIGNFTCGAIYPGNNLVYVGDDSGQIWKNSAVGVYNSWILANEIGVLYSNKITEISILDNNRIIISSSYPNSQYCMNLIFDNLVNTGGGTVTYSRLKITKIDQGKFLAALYDGDTDLLTGDVLLSVDNGSNWTNLGKIQNENNIIKFIAIYLQGFETINNKNVPYGYPGLDENGFIFGSNLNPDTLINKNFKVGTLTKDYSNGSNGYGYSLTDGNIGTLDYYETITSINSEGWNDGDIIIIRFKAYNMINSSDNFTPLPGYLRIYPTDYSATLGNDSSIILQLDLVSNAWIDISNTIRISKLYEQYLSINKPPILLKTFFDDAITSLTDETDLYSFTINGNTLKTDGDIIEAEYNLKSSGAIGDIGAYFAGTQLLFTTNSFYSGSNVYSCKILIIRTSSSTAKVISKITKYSNVSDGSNSTEYSNYVELNGKDWTNNNDIKLSGIASVGNITARYGTIKYLKFGS